MVVLKFPSPVSLEQLLLKALPLVRFIYFQQKLNQLPVIRCQIVATSSFAPVTKLMILWVSRRPKFLRLPVMTVWTLWAKIGQMWKRRKVQTYSNAPENAGQTRFCLGSEGEFYVFTEERLDLAPFAMIFTTGPADPLINRQCFCCLICKRNIPMKSQRLYDMKKHSQRNHHSRADQRIRA